MPNIEIHVQISGSLHPDTAISKANELEAEIFKRTEGMPFASDVVVSRHDTACRDRKDRSTPFIRVCCTDRQQIGHIVEALRGLADIEVLQLSGFVPKS